MSLSCPKSEQIPNDFYRKGDTIKAIVKSVEMNNNQPRIILSRTANQFLERLFEQEVPEIFDGLITIKKIVRIPGERAKVAVESYDDRIDPVGACVGMKGSRIYSIVKELRNENIDVVNYTANPQLMIQRSLNPAKISSHHHRRGEEDRFGLPEARPSVARHRQGRSQHPSARRCSPATTSTSTARSRRRTWRCTEFADEIEPMGNRGTEELPDAIRPRAYWNSPSRRSPRAPTSKMEQAQKVVEILKAEFEE